MRNDRQIDRQQHGLTRAVVEDFATYRDLLAALRRDRQTKRVNTIHRPSRCIAAVKRERRKSCHMITGAADVTRDSLRQPVNCRLSRIACINVLIHDV